MGIGRLRGIHPGRYGLFAGPLNSKHSAVQRDFAREAERLGYGTIWLSESAHMEPFTRAAMLLAATERLVVGTGIASIWVRDATAMAGAGRTLADAWPDRFILGLGVSHAPSVQQRGHDYERPYSAMQAYLDAIASAAWRGPDVELPPIVLAALGPRMAALAGERTAGAYPYFTTAAHVREVRSILGPEPFLVADLPVVMAGSLAEARAIGSRHTSYYLGVANYRNNLLRLGWSEADLEGPGSDELFEAVVAWGDIDRIHQQMAARFEAGADQVAFNLLGPDPAEPPYELLRALAAGFAGG